MKRAILLGDSPFIREVEDKVQYALERYYSAGINRIVTKFRTNAHIFVDLDLSLIKLTNRYPELFTISLKKYGDLIMKKNKKLIDTYAYNFEEDIEKDLYVEDKLAWCGFTHDYALSYLITEGYNDIVLLGTADFITGAHYSSLHNLKCSQKLINDSKNFIENVCRKRACIRTCNPNSSLNVPRISMDELLEV